MSLAPEPKQIYDDLLAKGYCTEPTQTISNLFLIWQIFKFILSLKMCFPSVKERPEIEIPELKRSIYRGGGGWQDRNERAHTP